MSLFNRILVTTLPLVPKPMVGWVARRYVAGETVEQAVETIRRLNAEGALVTVDLLGEEIQDRAQATAAVGEYQRVLAAIEEHDLRCNISVKPTQLGLDLDETFCRDNIAGLVERSAARADGFVRIDMEDRRTTDATLRIYREIHRRHDPGPRGRLGVVFQAYMRRTLQDIAELPSAGANVRLCKGIYIEPRQDAWKGYQTVRLNYLAALEQLLRRGVYVGIATHDEYLVCGAVALLDQLKVPADRYEFQMLLGVEQELRRILLAAGHRLRVYVPYGRDWYLYSLRRLRENPEVAGHVLRSFLKGN